MSGDSSNLFFHAPELKGVFDTGSVPKIIDALVIRNRSRVVAPSSPPLTVVALWPIILSFLDYWDHKRILSSHPFRSWFTTDQLETMRKLWVKALSHKAIYGFGCTEITLCEKRHCETGPALLYRCGESHWYLEGKRHRIGGPAMELANGLKEWWVMGRRHRDGGPALDFPKGTREWWIRGKRHRIGGPAIEYRNGDKEWWENGFLIRRIENRFIH